MRDRAFDAQQRSYWSSADEARFQWQTHDPVLAPREAELAQHVGVSPGDRLLEIGCGEGANLHHLRRSGALRFGIDYSLTRAAFAHRATEAHTATADATMLPFGGGSFDAVLIRDLLHHVRDAAAVLREAHRVLKRGGRLTLVEPNRLSPLIWLQAALVPAERGVLRSSASRLTSLLASAGFELERHVTEQPFPIERVLLHPSVRPPSLAAGPLTVRALAVTDRWARRLLPARSWMYLVFEAISR
jgi:SAM-dependent methyltransferase